MERLLEKMPGRDLWERLSPYLPPLNFITAHYLYFIATPIVTSVIFYCTSTPAWSITYTDSLYLVVSAMTEAGLNTVNLSSMNTFQQWLLWMHILGGSAIFVSIFVVHFRKNAFEKRFGALIKSQREQTRRRRASWRSTNSRSISRIDVPAMNNEKPPPDRLQDSNTPAVDHLKIDTAQQNGHVGSETETSDPASSNILHPEQQDNTISPISPQTSGPEHISFVPQTSFRPGDFSRKRRGSMISFTGVGASPVTTSFRRPGQPYSTDRRPTSRLEPNVDNTDDPGFPWHRRNPLSREILGRNSQFHGLTLEEREQLGGIEYRAITLLSWVVPAYFVLWQFLGCVAVGAWMANNASDITLMNGINPWWNGAFNAVSAFNNSGMSLLDANMIPFQQSTYPVLTMGLLILAGNTAYPVFLRIILWAMYRLTPNTPYLCVWRDTLRFVLDHPRRVYTNLFPATPTWWLAGSLIFLNGIDWIAFELLNINNEAVTSIPPGSRALDGLFQALAVRSGGFYIVPIPSLRIGVQVLYVLMMYISAYPVVITMRNSNVYEERSLGIYADDPAEQRARDEEMGPLGRLKRSMTLRTSTGETRGYFIQQQVRGQLAHDLSWLAIAVLLIVCIEVGSFDRDPITFSVFNVVFEVVSGYGCVGITTGLPDQAYSFSGAWHVVSKLILCAVMIRGRHRGLPVAIDRAVLLPGEHLGNKEEEDHDIRRAISRDEGGNGGMGSAGGFGRADGGVSRASGVSLSGGGGGGGVEGIFALGPANGNRST